MYVPVLGVFEVEDESWVLARDGDLVRRLEKDGIW